AVPGPHNEHLLTVRSGPVPQLGQVGQERVHEAFLLILPLGTDLAARQIQTGQHQPGKLRLEITTTVVELAVPESDSGRDRLVPTVDRDPVTSLDLRRCASVRDEPPLRSTDVLGKLLRSRANLLAG